MRLATLFILFLAGYSLLPAQYLNYAWDKTFGGVAADHSFALVTDGRGFVYHGGQFQSTVDFDPGPGINNVTAVGLFDAYVQKLDSNGQPAWLVTWGGISNDAVLGITVDHDQNVYVVGHFWGTIDLDPGPGVQMDTSAGVKDNFIVKLDSTGGYVWGFAYGSPGGDRCLALSQDSQNDLYITGSFSNTVDFDPGPGVSNLYSAGGEDIFVMKLDDSGNFQWARNVGGTGTDVSQSIAVDSVGNSYTSAWFYGLADFNPGPGANWLGASGIYSMGIIKLDPNGNYIWSKGWTDCDYAFELELYGSQGLIVAGAFGGMVDFDPGAGTQIHTSVGVRDMYLMRLDTAGELDWLRTVGGPHESISFALACDSTDDILVCGVFRDTMDVDPGPDTLVHVPQGDRDIFLQKYDSSGALIYSNAFGGTGMDTPFALETTDDGELYMGGMFSTIVNFDPDSIAPPAYSNGVTDLFVLKFHQSQCPPPTVLHTFACSSYLSPSSNYIWSSSGIYQDTIVNGQQCDSTFRIYLTISNIDSTIAQIGDTLWSNEAGATYQWLDCENNLAVLPGDTQIYYAPPRSGNYAVAVTQNGCIDTSACYPFQIIGRDLAVEQDEIILYPNPGNNRVQFLSAGEIKHIELYALDGRKLFETRETILNISELSKGIYFAKVYTETGVSVLRLQRE